MRQIRTCNTNMDKTLDVEKSLMSLPLYNSNHCICAFLGQMILGQIEEDKVTIHFQFYLNEIVVLYSALVNCAKYFGGLEPKAKKSTFLKKSNQLSYIVAFNSNLLEGDQIKTVSFGLESNNKLLCEISFDEADFCRFVEATSIVLWHCLGLSKSHLNMFLSYLELPLTDFVQFKDFEKLKKFLKDKENAILIAQLTRYHFPLLVTLHKLHNLFNNDVLNNQIREIFEFS